MMIYVKYAVFNVEIVRTVAKLFPQNLGLPFLESTDTGVTRLQAVLDKVAELRTKAQSWLLVQDLAPSVPSSSNQGAQTGHAGQQPNYSGHPGGASHGRGLGAHYGRRGIGFNSSVYKSTCSTALRPNI